MTTLFLVERTARQNGSFFERLTNTFRTSMARRTARHQLMKLEDHILDDIGLTRVSIMSDEF